jgi:undecaprenyl pyrophosphate synthase
MKLLNLQHLALICDGNRRWGKRNGLRLSADFYLKSGLNGRDIAIAAFEYGVANVSVWIGSVANLTARGSIEVRALNKAYTAFFEDEKNLAYALKNRIKIDCIGRWRELLEPATVRAIEKTVAATADFPDDSRRLTVLIGYDGTDERGAALQQLLASPDDISFRAGSGVTTPVATAEPRNDGREDVVREGNSSGKRADKKDVLNNYSDLLRQNSWTGHLPDVDLTIRTGCADDPHNSAGFLSMLVDNVQYAFLDTLWPDFTPEMLHQVLDNFAARERRMGK